MALRLAKQVIPAPVKRWLRRTREAIPILLEPIDYLGRVVTGKQDQPPMHLRKIAGPLRSFETSSAEFLAHVRATIGLSPENRVLDLGCGCGGTALQLVGFFAGSGRYVGVDIQAPSVRWAQRNLTRRDSHLDFQLLDVRSAAYNPRGAHSAATYRFSFPDHSFDLVIAKSLFTHLRPAEVDNYIKEIGRLLAVDGHCALSFFLLTPFRQDLVRRGGSPAFRHGDGVWRYQNEYLPEAACAYDEEHVRHVLRIYGFRVEGVIYGFQDMLLASRLPR